MNKKQFEQVTINQAISNDVDSALRCLSNLIGFATRLGKFDEIDELCTQIDALSDQFTTILKNSLPDEE